MFFLLVMIVGFKLLVSLNICIIKSTQKLVKASVGMHSIVDMIIPTNLVCVF